MIRRRTLTGVYVEKVSAAGIHQCRFDRVNRNSDNALASPLEILGFNVVPT
jgi:hypothetical protein